MVTRPRLLVGHKRAEQARSMEEEEEEEEEEEGSFDGVDAIHVRSH